MAKLGAPGDIKSAMIGAVELRIGALSSAGNLDQSHSVGVVDDFTLKAELSTVDLMAMFPEVVVASAITKQPASATCKYREFTVRNLNMQLGNGIIANPTDVATTIAASAAKGATSVTVATGAGANFDVGDVVVIYPANRPEDTSILQIASISVDTLTFVTGQVTAAAYVSGDILYLGRKASFGAASFTEYFTATAIAVSPSTGRPIVFNMWKISASGLMELAHSRTDWQSSALELKFVQPSTEDVTSGGDLDHLAARIAANPLVERVW